MDSWLVRGTIQAYRPMLAFALDHPVSIVWFVGVTFLVGIAPLGYRGLFLATLAAALLASLHAARRTVTRIAVVISLTGIALVAQRLITPLGYEPITPLDEGMIMDMPITVPWASVAQATDDLKARDMIFCRFPEVDMVVGKAGRAETSTDPAPLDMIETMVNFRPQELWPRRKLRPADAERQARAALDALSMAQLIGNPGGDAARASLVSEAVMAALPIFDAQMREYVHQRNQEFERELGHTLIRAGREELAVQLYGNRSLSRRLSPIEMSQLSEPSPAGFALRLAHDLTPDDVSLLTRDTIRQLEQRSILQPGGDPLRYRPGILHRLPIALDSLLGGTPPTLFSHLYQALTKEQRRRWREHIQTVNQELPERASPIYTRLILEELLGRLKVIDAKAAEYLHRRRDLHADSSARKTASSGHNHHGASSAPTSTLTIDPHPALDSILSEQSRTLAARLQLWPIERSELTGFGGELDRAMQMPGWTNVWTMPIQNRVDMLSTGVNTTVGVRVLGRRLEDVVRASEEVATVLAKVPGAVNVVADRLRGKGYLQVRPDRERAARLGVRGEDINELVEIALGGRVVTQTLEGRERHAVRIRYSPEWRADEESARAVPVPVFSSPGRYVRLADVADVSITEGPATIKSENGLLRNYVRLNVRGRDSGEFVEEARRAVAARVALPPGIHLEWTGQFEHEQKASNTLMLILPLVILLIFLTLWLTYHDLADAVLMMFAVPGALAGGVFAQWLFGFQFSVTVWVGYIACFGMATATGIIMLVYLREAVDRAGGLEKLTLDQLRQAVMDGAVHRLRPKLLTECTMSLGLAPLLWSSGVGAEVIRPMVVPVLGGILIADEVIDLFLPVLFYWERRRRWHRLRGLHQEPTRSFPTPEGIVS
jgi:Cu(I)/Ag(I) efflux system membrane protein CusA/SilA